MSDPRGLVIDVRGLRKNFGDRSVVDGLTLQVAEGEICGFLGANGSGKTTTIRMLCGLLVPDGGSGTCLGHDIVREAPLIRRQVGYMTQKFSYYEDLTVFENLDLVASVYEMRNGRAAVREIMERMGLADRAKQLAGQLSGGWKQRLALAACVLHQPKLLLLDEPTAGVDAKARREFWDLIHDMAGEGLTVLVSTHYMDEAERCKRIVYLAGGRIVVQGSAAEVVTRSGLITFEATGPDIDEAARRMRRMPGVEAAAVFGQVLHIAGTDRAKLGDAITAYDKAGLSWREVEPRLEDVFIHMLSEREMAA
jgi:ABC-type multidrug transport system ATPase subunit